jgi:hypothetical protein
MELELLKEESMSMGFMMEAGTTTITFYKGDFAAASAALRAQFGKVVAANPWLAGRLVKTKAGVRLRYPDVATEEICSSLFKAEGAAKLDPKMPYDKLCAELKKAGAVCETGTKALDKDKERCFLTLAESTEAPRGTEGQFALIFSLCHSTGDGRTYYEILKMLKPGAEVRALPTARVQSFSDTYKETLGKNAAQAIGWSESVGGGWQMFLPLFKPLLCGPKVKAYAFYVDEEKLAAAKALGAKDGGVPFVSTNDVLQSGFCNAVKARACVMAMDCRGKVEGVGMELAGNYVAGLVLDSEVFSTPAGIRQMMTEKPMVTTKKKLPGCCGGCGVKVAQLSNWSSFAGGLVPLDGCEMGIHLPVVVGVFFDCMCIFTADTGRKGVICWTLRCDENGLRAALPLGESLSKDLFPQK